MSEPWFEKFARLREAKGWGRTDAARALIAVYPHYGDDQLQTAVSTVKRWEAGKVADPGDGFKAAIAAIFDLPVADFWERSPLRDSAVPDSLAPDEFTELVQAFQSPSVGQASLDQAHAQVERLCSAYASQPAPMLTREVNRWVSTMNELRKGGGLSLAGYEQVWQMTGWLALLRSCLMWDQGNEGEATRARVAAESLAKELNHPQIGAWGSEIQAWIALTRGDMPQVIAHADTGIALAPTAPVAAQLWAQKAKAWSRMGDRHKTEVALDQVRGILDSNPMPNNVRNHFAVDPTKASFYAMDAYRVLRENAQAEAMAETVIRSSTTPTGEVISPMRLAEAELTRAVVLARAGDVEGAINLADQALNHDRRCVPSLMLVAGEVAQEIGRAHPEEAADFREHLQTLSAVDDNPGAA